MKELRAIEIVSGVNEQGKAFCTVSCTTKDNALILGQLDPDTVRTLAMQWLESAEAAEQDAAVMRVIRKLDLPVEVAALVVGELRSTRKEDR